MNEPGWCELWLLALVGGLGHGGFWIYYWMGMQSPGMVLMIFSVVLLTIVWSDFPDPEGDEE